MVQTTTTFDIEPKLILSHATPTPS